jgi:proteic killer suppression protein
VRSCFGTNVPHYVPHYDLRVPPGNRLEALKGNRAGQHSIRVNDQFRVCFVWTTEGPKDVEIVDYH